MARLRRVSQRQRGWTRRRAGRGFVYLDHEGARLSEDEVARIRALVIPPAWEDVWICPLPQGHLQAVGTDAAGRRQYLYHPDWRARQDELKFDRVARAARRLPRARRTVATQLGREGLGGDRVAALAFRLLDLGCFRIGGDTELDSYGLTTLERRHCRVAGDRLVFEFTGKSGVEQVVEVEDATAAEVVRALLRRRGERLLVWRDGRRWVDLTAADVNAYLSEVVGQEFTAKDFRTWHATVLAAVALATSPESGETAASRRRAVRAAMTEVGELLGNSATIARTSYVDPRVVDLYEDGVTIRAAVERRHRSATSRQVALERAVQRLLARA